MPDRLIRAELLESDRWLDLPTDAARLAFLGFLLTCDDFGNFEGGARRIFRALHTFTQIKTETASAEVLDALMLCDLLRRYEVGGRELFHIPRFRSHRQYLSRRYPMSPWCSADVTLGKDKRVKNQGLAKDVVATSLRRSGYVAEGVGVGVGELKRIGHHSEESPSSPSAQATVETLALQNAVDESVPKRRASRIPDDFPGETELAWGKAQRPDLDYALVAAIFRDYWTAKPGKDGLKLDWVATWRNWVRAQRALPARPAQKEMAKWD